MPSSASSGAVVFGGGVDGVLACSVVLVHMGLTMSENNMWKIGDQWLMYGFESGRARRVLPHTSNKFQKVGSSRFFL